MDWDEVLKTIAEKLDVPGLRLDDKGRASLLCDDWLRIELETAPYGLAMYAPVGRVPDFARDDIFAAMLSANLPDGGLGAARIGCDGDMVMLHMAFQSELNSDRILEGMANFVAVAEAWRMRLDDPRVGAGL